MVSEEDNSVKKMVESAFPGSQKEKLNFEEDVTNLALKLFKENFGKSTATRITEVERLISKVKSQVPKVARSKVEAAFQEKVQEYGEQVKTMPELFQAIYEVAKYDYSSLPYIESWEELPSYFSKSQKIFDKLKREVEIIKDRVKRLKRLNELQAKRHGYKSDINKVIDKQREMGIRMTPLDMTNIATNYYKLPPKFSADIVNELAAEKLERGEFELIEGEFSPVIHYRGKRIRAGLVYPGVMDVQNRGAPYPLKRSDVLTNICEDYDAFCEWMKSAGDFFHLDIRVTPDAVYVFKKG